MTIFHVITAFGFGGAEKLLVDLVNIQSRQHNVHIIYFKGEALLSPLLTGPVQLQKFDLSLSSSKQLRALIKEKMPDVVHSHLGHADLITMWACRNIRIKHFCTMHNIWFKWNWKDHLIFFIYRIFFKTISKKCKVIAISKSVYQHVETVLKVPKENIRLIYNAIPSIRIENDKNTIRKELNLNPNTFYILFVGRLEQQKSVETLLFAANELKSKIDDFVVLLVGEGSQKERLTEIVKEVNLQNNVVFKGTTGQVEKYFSASDIFVLPSVFEGFGIVLLEAFRASLPIITTNIEGPKELITHNHNGLLFEPKEHQKLSSHILQLYESPELRSKIGKNGNLSFQSKYDIVNYAKQIEELYQE